MQDEAKKEKATALKPSPATILRKFLVSLAQQKS